MQSPGPGSTTAAKLAGMRRRETPGEGRGGRAPGAFICRSTGHGDAGKTRQGLYTRWRVAKAGAARPPGSVAQAIRLRSAWSCSPPLSWSPWPCGLRRFAGRWPCGLRLPRMIPAFFRAVNGAKNAPQFPRRGECGEIFLHKFSGGFSVQNAVHGGIIGGHIRQAIRIPDRARKLIPAARRDRRGGADKAGRAEDRQRRQSRPGGRSAGGAPVRQIGGGREAWHRTRARGADRLHQPKREGLTAKAQSRAGRPGRKINQGQQLPAQAKHPQASPASPHHKPAPPAHTTSQPRQPTPQAEHHKLANKQG